MPPGARGVVGFPIELGRSDLGDVKQPFDLTAFFAGPRRFVFRQPLLLLGAVFFADLPALSVRRRVSFPVAPALVRDRPPFWPHWPVRFVPLPALSARRAHRFHLRRRSLVTRLDCLFLGPTLLPIGLFQGAFILLVEIETDTSEAGDDDQRGRAHHCGQDGQPSPALHSHAFATLLLVLLCPLERLLLPPFVAALLDHGDQNIVRQLDSLDTEPFLDVEQAALHQFVDGRAGRSALRDRPPRTAHLDVVPEPRIGQKLVFHERPHSGRLVGQAAAVEILQDALAAPLQQGRRDLLQMLVDPPRVKLTADQAQQRRIDFQPSQFQPSQFQPSPFQPS